MLTMTNEARDIIRLIPEDARFADTAGLRIERPAEADTGFTVEPTDRPDSLRPRGRPRRCPRLPGLRSRRAPGRNRARCPHRRPGARALPRLLTEGLNPGGLRRHARSGAVANSRSPSAGRTAAAKPSSARGPLRRGHDVPDVAEPVAAGDLGLDACTGAGADHLGDLRGSGSAGRTRRCRRRSARAPEADDRLQGGDVGAGDVGDVHEVAHLAAVLEDLRRARRAPARSGTSPPRRSTACPAACPGRRRCGSAARPPPRRPGAPTRTCSAPGRPCWRRTTSAGRAGRPRRPAPSRAPRRRPGSGCRSRRPSRAARVRGGGAWSPCSGQV